MNIKKFAIRFRAKINLNFQVSKRTFLLFLLCVLSGFQGCTSKPNDQKVEYIIRVEDSNLTLSEFNQAFQIEKINYPKGFANNPDFERDTKIGLLGQLLDEMILLQRAKELKIEVSDSDVEEALKKAKEEYPDDVLEKMLLNNALPYHVWEKRLKKRAIIDRVIEYDLGSRIEVTHDDVANYYQKKHKDNGFIPDSRDSKTFDEKMIVKYLRMEKLKEILPSWVQDLKSRYNIEINPNILEKLDKL